MAWAILHLCGSPWLSETWTKDDIYFFLKSNTNTAGLESLANNPCISCGFGPTAASASAVVGLATTPAERFHSNLIRNKPLFALGILLIELGIKRSFEDIRRDHCQVGTTQPTVPDDYEIANGQIDDVYLDAGNSYGYAAQRCLRLEFPGRDGRKNLDFPEFRQEFYNGVVAPIQAAFSMVPASCSLI